MRAIRDRHLPDIGTRRLRFYDLTPVGEYTDAAEYVLTVRQWTGNYTKFERESYAVQEVSIPPEHAEPHRVFLLVKLSPPASDVEPWAVYECRVPWDARRRSRCTCLGNKTADVCKHAAALGDAVRTQNSEPVEPAARLDETTDEELEQWVQQ